MVFRLPPLRVKTKLMPVIQTAQFRTQNCQLVKHVRSTMTCEFHEKPIPREHTYAEHDSDPHYVSRQSDEKYPRRAQLV